MQQNKNNNTPKTQNSIRTVLVTGGAGYIGSHTVLELLNANYNVIVVDNLSNSSKESINRVEQITDKKITFYNENVANQNALDNIFASHPQIDNVIHFAGYKAVGESVAKPFMYYQNNIGTTLSLIASMKKHNVKNIVFSSSATVYGLPTACPLTEDMSTSALNPYGNTKKIIEEIFIDEATADSTFNVALLRYFNPVGAHHSGLIGEDPRGIPNNLMPFVTKVAVGKLERLNVFGNDYDTPDGTAIRDYIHVVDLALGHLSALEKLYSGNCGVVTYNIGTGKGSSVMDVINAFIKATGVDVPYIFAPRRAGDAPVCYASVQKAKKELNYTAARTLQQMCLDHYIWQKNNPNGYEE
ncbi:MAG: UDP-glucose 4-epimerase GalE [Firmicutes bacterium]|nr:UDP-glucose 4-epimerase GalE [Bacillota bacterium]